MAEEEKEDPGRTLTVGERRLAFTVFGNVIGSNRVRIYQKKFMVFQPKDIVMSPDGNIYFHPEGSFYRDDLSHGDKWIQHLFIHEMAHVWQHQTGVAVMWRGMFEREYKYTLDVSKPLKQYSLEQQAQIIADYFLLKKFSTRANFSQGKKPPSLADYEKVIRFIATPKN